MAGCLRLFRLEFTDNYTKIGNRIGLLRSWLWSQCIRTDYGHETNAEIAGGENYLGLPASRTKVP